MIQPEQRTHRNHQVVRYGYFLVMVVMIVPCLVDQMVYAVVTPKAFATLDLSEEIRPFPIWLE